MYRENPAPAPYWGSDSSYFQTPIEIPDPTQNLPTTGAGAPPPSPQQTGNTQPGQQPAHPGQTPSPAGRPDTDMPTYTGGNWQQPVPPGQGQSQAEPQKELDYSGSVWHEGTSNTAGGPQNGDFRSWFMQQVAGKPPTPQTLLAMKDDLAKHGIKVMTNASGVAGKIQLPSGEIIDVIQSAGTGGTAWQWLSGPGGGGAGSPAQVAPPPTPMIMPNGMPPPGLPYMPPQDLVAKQDALFNDFLTNPQYDQNYINRQNEQQKEIALGQEQQQQRAISRNAASRGVARGGAAQAASRRASFDTTQQLLASNRDTQNNAVTANRQGFLNAIQGSQSVFNDRQDRSMALQKFLESIREYGLDDAYRYALANQNAEQFYTSLFK